jgi:hypothetical protein
MNANHNTFDNFAHQLVRKHINPRELALAKDWYKIFAGAHAVKMDDNELVEIYRELH